MKTRSFITCLAGMLLAALPSSVLAQSATPDATGTGTTNYITRWISATAQGNSLLYQNPSTNRIGIGTTTPSTTFDVANGNILARGIGGFTGSGNSGSVFVGDAGHGITAYRGGGLVTYGGTAISAYHASNRIFLQDTTGNVGIGTTSPRYALHVNGTSYLAGGLYLQDGNGGCTYVYANNGNLYSYSSSC